VSTSLPGRPLETRLAGLLARAERLVHQAASLRVEPLQDDAALRVEAQRLRPVLEGLAGRRYGRLPRVGFRRGLEAWLAGPWSQYLTLGIGPTRLVRITAWEATRPVVPTLLAHELAHRFAFDESVTTLRGLEASARLAEAGDRRHALSVRLELARLALGAAMAQALAAGRPEPIDAFFERAGSDAWVRSRSLWERLRERGRADWALTVYAALPCAALDEAAGEGALRSAPLSFPRFRVSSPQAAFCALTTSVDALTRRRRARVPLDALQSLWARVR
jgi:hypothetical protein